MNNLKAVAQVVMKLQEGVSVDEIIEKHRADFDYEGRINTVVECWSKIISKEAKPSKYALELMNDKVVSDNDHIESPSQYYTQPKAKPTAHEPDDWQEEQIQEKLGLGEYGCLPSQHIMFQH